MSNLLSRIYNFVTDKANTVKITASRVDAELDQIITGMNRKVLCSASAPSSPIAGQSWFDTTNKYLKVYRNNEWCIITVVHVGSSAPSTLQEGDVWYDTTNDLLKAYNGSAWLTIGPTTTAIGGAYKNLKVSRSSATQVVVTADELILKDSSGIPVIISSVNVTGAITSSGANGLDTGPENSNTWYFVWVIRKSSDGTVAALLSTSSSSPTMPSGYDQKALVSAVRNDGSSNFITFVHEGNLYWYSTWRAIYNGATAPWNSLDTTGYVPSALSTLVFGAIASSSGYGAKITNDNTTSTTNTAPDVNNYMMRSAGSGGSDEIYFRLNILTANTIYSGGDAGVAHQVYIAGFEVNKLG